MTTPPIMLEKRTLLRENAVFRVYSDHVRDASGGEIPDYLAVVPRHRTPNKVSGVAVLPEVDGKFGLISIYRYPLAERCWEIPRGFVEADEDPADAAARELLEETALVPGEPLVDLGLLAPEPGVIDAKVALFAARRCTRRGSVTANEIGHGELRFFTPDETLALMREDGILDPYTLVAILKLFKYEAMPPA